MSRRKNELHSLAVHVEGDNVDGSGLSEQERGMDKGRGGVCS